MVKLYACGHYTCVLGLKCAMYVYLLSSRDVSRISHLPEYKFILRQMKNKFLQPVLRLVTIPAGFHCHKDSAAAPFLQKASQGSLAIPLLHVFC